MLSVFLTILVIAITFCILVYSEYLARAKQIHAELTRKLVHVAVGSFVAFWPFFLSWREIQWLSLAFFAVVCISIKYNIFSSIHAVKRSITGELLFAIVIGLLALISSNKWVFMAAMLNLSLADGLAAVVGIGWGEKHAYRVFGRTKSIAGTVTFFVISLLILIAYGIFAHASLSPFTYVWLPIVAAAAENLAVQGTDNIVIPMLIALVLMNG